MTVYVFTSLIQGDIAIAYIPAVPWKGIKHWSTGVNQESIKLLSNLKQSDLTLIIVATIRLRLSL